jgi:hypothetical protein
MKTTKSTFSKTIFFWVAGFLALVWFILRTGTNPKRLNYPCQRAAFPLASAFLISVVSIFSGILVFRKVYVSSVVILVVCFLALFNISSVKEIGTTASVSSVPAWVVTNPVSKVFVMDTVYNTKGSLAAGNSSVPDANLDDPTMDSLFNICSTNGLYLYKGTAHSDGIVGKNDIVIIKGNFQWDGRLGTNTDRIKGLIRLILAHPDGFTGEILVCDNIQDIGSTGEKNNSDDLAQSIQDVVNTFHAKGFPVFFYGWNTLWHIFVKEYSASDNRDGYILQKDKVTYPKFKSPSGNTYISMRYGIWNSGTASYDKNRLTIINFPVLKAHCMAGVTEGIKNWVGMLTTAAYDSLYGSWDAMHYTYFWGTYALIARVMAVTAPKLTIVDASYTATVNNFELSNNPIVKTNKMVVSTDPVAASWYSAKYILKPIAANKTLTDPDNLSTSADAGYGPILRKWTKYLVDSAHLPYTLDPAKISVYKSKGAPTLIPAQKAEITKPLIIYPNPSNGSFTITLPVTADHAQVLILTENGVELLNKTFLAPGNKCFVNVNLKTGIYVLKVLVNGHLYGNKLLIK